MEQLFSLADVRLKIDDWTKEGRELVELRDLLNATLDGRSAPRKRVKRGPGRPKGSKNATKLAPVTTGVAQGRKGQKGRAVAHPEPALD
jgi:hypothetical protein